MTLLAVDVHTHVVPSALPPLPSGATLATWPSIEQGTCGHARVLVGGQPYRDIEDSCWRAERRIEEMTAMGIGRQVLSPMPELLSYWLPAADARCVARHVNEQIAALVAASRPHFVGFAMVPLQSVPLAIEELVHATTVLGLGGIELGTTIEGKPLGHPSFDPFFAEVEARGIPVFVHPLRPTGMDRLIGPPLLEQVVAFPCETALCIASVLTGGLLTRHPKLRLAFSHGGGTFGQVLPRLQHGWSLSPPLQKAMPRSPREQARDLFYDTLVYDAAALRFLIAQFGASQLLLGTDYPFPIMEKNPLERVTELALPEDERALLTHSNAERYLG